MKRLLVIGHVWPEPTTTAAGNRMLQLLQAFSEKGYEITFGSTAGKTDFSHELTALGIDEATIKLNDSGFDDFVKDLTPDLVLFDRFMVEEQFGWRVAAQCPRAVRILNSEDLHSLRDYRCNCLKKEVSPYISGWQKTDKAKREMASVYRSDLTLLVSTYEQRLLTEHVNIDSDLSIVLPFMLEEFVENERANWPDFHERRDFITYGNGQHGPNVDSFRYLKETIWPLIVQALPAAQLYVYGAYLPQSITELHNPKDRFFVHGWVEDLEGEVQKARVTLAPLRYGAGIKGKLTMAMQNGTPSVTTGIGVEGMPNAIQWPGFVEDDPHAFAKLAVDLYRNQTIWESAQKRGIQMINGHFSKRALQKRLFEKLEFLTQNLDNHRNKNFIGSMLQHQSMAATKYMGKWIEAKNKKSN